MNEMCERCKCCSVSIEATCCWSCNGWLDEDDEWDDGWCEVCQGEGEVYFPLCFGSCDENGKHTVKT